MARTKFAGLPPTVTGATAARIPAHLWEDAAQEAWAAHLAGEDPGAALCKYVRRMLRHERRGACFSQLGPEQQRRILLETPA
jgi:hypothetical protein